MQGTTVMATTSVIAASGVAERLEQRRNRGVFGAKTEASPDPPLLPKLRRRKYLSYVRF
jgi:hypothetical protein